MPTSLSDSEIFLLRLIWQLSVALASLSIFIMLALIVRRMLGNLRRARQAGRRDFLTRALQSIVVAQSMPAAEALPPIEKSDRPIVLRLALNMLRSLRGGDEQRIVQTLKMWNMMPYVRHTLMHGGRGRQIQALTLLSHFDDDESLTLLKSYADDAEPYVQLAALRGLAARNAQEALAEIVPRLGRSRQRNTIMLADILQRFGAAAVAALAGLASGNAALEIRLAAITALGAIGSLDAVQPLIVLTQNPLPDIRAQAIAALGRIRDTRAEPAVLRTLDDPEEAVRIQAAQAAGSLELSAAIPKLFGMVGSGLSASAQEGYGATASACSASGGWWLRYRAAEALIRLGAPGVSLLQTIAGQSSDAGRMAQMALAEKGI